MFFKKNKEFFIFINTKNNEFFNKYRTELKKNTFLLLNIRFLIHFNWKSEEIYVKIKEFDKTKFYDLFNLVPMKF